MEQIIPQKELESLGDLISYLVFQREKGKPVAFLHQTLKDLKRLIKRIIINHYIPLNMDEEYQFMSEVSDFLYEIHVDISEDGFDEIFLSYLVNEVLSAFKKADGIKYGVSHTVADMPIMKNFDFKLRPLFRLIKPEAC